MGRLIKSKNSGVAERSAEPEKSTPQQDYFERVGKYIPGEIIAGYVGLLSFLGMTAENLQFGASIGIFVLCLILTPLYFQMMANNKDNKKHIRLHQLVSTVAFIIWAYAIGNTNGIFGTEGLGWYDAGISSMLLLAFTLVSGLITPKE